MSGAVQEALEENHAGEREVPEVVITGIWQTLSAVYRSYIPHDRFLWILLNLLLLTIVFPSLDNSKKQDDLLALFFSLYLFTVPYALRKDDESSPWIYYFTLPCCLIGCALLILPDTLPGLNNPKLVILIRNLVHMLFFLSTGFYLLREVWQDKAAGFDKILGGCCLYLIVGTLWAYSYGIVEEMHPNSFSVAQKDFLVGKGEPEGEHVRGSVLLYFSFITLTTVGFGDVTPLTSIARTLVWLEAVFGQFLVTVLLARLVSMYLDYAKENSKSIQKVEKQLQDIPVPSAKYHPRINFPGYESLDDPVDAHAA